MWLPLITDTNQGNGYGAYSNIADYELHNNRIGTSNHIGTHPFIVRELSSAINRKEHFESKELSRSKVQQACRVNYNYCLSS